MWEEECEYIQSLRNPAGISTERIKWSSDVKRDFDTFLRMNLSNRNRSGGTITKRWLDVINEQKKKE